MFPLREPRLFSLMQMMRYFCVSRQHCVFYQGYRFSLRTKTMRPHPLKVSLGYELFLLRKTWNSFIQFIDAFVWFETICWIMESACRRPKLVSSGFTYFPKGSWSIGTSLRKPSWSIGTILPADFPPCGSRRTGQEAGNMRCQLFLCSSKKKTNVGHTDSAVLFERAGNLSFENRAEGRWHTVFAWVVRTFPKYE